MEWEEFTAYIIEAGLAAKAAEEQGKVISTKYKIHHNKSGGKRIEKMVYLGAPATCVAVFNGEDTDVLTLLDLPVSGREARPRVWTSLRHHNQMRPQQVTAVCVIRSKDLLVTASHVRPEALLYSKRSSANKLFFTSFPQTHRKILLMALFLSTFGVCRKRLSSYNDSKSQLGSSLFVSVPRPTVFMLREMATFFRTPLFRSFHKMVRVL